MVLIDLAKFCAKDSRFHVNEPFSRGEWTYATDGCICIRVPFLEFPSLPHVPENKNAPDAERLFIEADKHGPYDWVSVPEVEVPTLHCNSCDGKGIDCYECKGTGIICQEKAVTLLLRSEIILLSNIYLDLIAKELPNPKLGLLARNRPVKIKFNGGEGLLMPMGA